ncbi:MAG: autotransporter domain-containing protein [Hyphomicrobiaceae bacterium]|nr:autotransporter domain-containing protein [Hyphomicrobiaceae bacterium]
MRCSLGGRVALASASALAIGVVLAAGAARAADVTVPDNTTVTGQKTISGADKVTVGSGGKLTSSSNPTILQSSSAAGIVIDNSGIIESTATGGRAIRFNGGTSMTFTISNRAGATIQSQNDAIQVNPSVTSGTIVVDNWGLIQSTGVNSNNGQAIDFGAVAGTTSITITNFATGIIQTADADAIRPGNAAVIHNYGQITSNNYLTNSGADAIDYQTSTSGTVYNYAGGIISGGRHGINISYDSTKNAGTDAVTVYNWGTIIGRNGSGIGSDVSGVVVNYGTITGTADGIPGVANGDGDGVDIDYKATITNYGIIQGTGAKGVGSDGLANTSEAIAIGGGTVDNKAGATIYGAGNGILVDNSSQGNAFYKVEITNAGTIAGGTGYGIYIRSAFDNVITNSGTITGGNGKAIVFGDGNDTLNILTGSVINGTVDGGAGSNTVNLAGTGTFAGTINFQRLNLLSGTWTLTGTESYADGAYISDGGTLIETGNLGATVNVASGGTLAGTGTVGGVVLASGGTISPGLTPGAIGTLTVAGNIAFSSGSQYLVDMASSGTSDRISAGTATLAGVVVVDAQSGKWTPTTNTTILETSGGYTGTFSSISTDLAFLTPSLVYDASSVTLLMTRNSVYFQDVAATGNQRAVATSLNTTPTDSPLFLAIVGQSAASARAAFDALSGEGMTGAITGGLQASGQFGAGVLSQAIGAGIDAGPGGAAQGDPAMMGLGMAAAKAKPDPLAATSRLRMWASAFDQNMRLGGSETVGSAATTSRQSGLLSGADVRLAPGLSLGLAAGYSDGAATTDARATRVAMTGYHLATYGVARSGSLYLAASGSYSGFFKASDRTVAALGTTEREKAEFTSEVIALRAEVGRTFALGRATVTPFAGLELARYLSGSYTETAYGAGSSLGALGLTVSGNRTDSAATALGVRLRSEETLANGMRIAPSLSLAWVHNFVTDRDLAASFTGVSADPFTVSGARADADLAQLRAGLSLRLSPRATVAAEIGTDQGAHTQSFSARGDIRLSW